MRAHRALLSALLALALPLLGGCSEREHANPLDPANPATQGRPVGFLALAENTFVRLVWSPATAPGVVGFTLSRRIAGSGAFVEVPVTLLASSRGTSDVGLTNGVTYEYQLHYVFSDGPGGPPAEDAATPGTARVWVSENGGGRIDRLTADGRHVAQTATVGGSPAELLVDQSGWLWATNGSGTLATVTASGAPPVSLSGFVRPGVIAEVPLAGALWVCDEDAGLLRHVLTDGSPASPASIGSLDVPTGVAIDPADRSVWVCENGGDRVRRFSAAGVQLGATTVSRPSRIAIDSLTREVWVTSFTTGRIVRLTSEVLPADTLTAYPGPFGIAIDHRRGHVWIADSALGALVLLDRTGHELARVTGLPGARTVAVEMATGEAWVTAGAAGTVARVSPNGVRLATTGGLATPWGIAAEPQ